MGDNKIGAIGANKAGRTKDVQAYIEKAKTNAQKFDIKKLIGNSVWTTDASAASYFGAGASYHGASGIK